ncbi:hypothetical protein J9332_19670 [Aquimarina celericrescens]|nr:hypothetical protein [Aquimarina celericrescens]
MENEDKSPRKTWDLMIGIALILFGGLRLYNRWQTEANWSLQSILTILFIGYGAFLVFRYFKNSSKL